MADTIIVDVGTTVKKHRMERKMTQQQLGEAVGLGQSEISRIEHNKVRPGDPKLVLIAKELEFKYSEYFLGIGHSAEIEVTDSEGDLKDFYDQLYALVPYVKYLPPEDRNEILNQIMLRFKVRGVPLPDHVTKRLTIK